jgi:HAMP domain-containing protein
LSSDALRSALQLGQLAIITPDKADEVNSVSGAQEEFDRVLFSG